MTKTLKYALTAVLGVGLIVPALAQDNFPDAPENHWAYEALARLKKDGLLVGYPDGLFRGSRPASRYELAVAIHAAYTNLRNVTDGLQSQIDALKSGNPDVQSLRDAITALQAQVNAMKGYGDDIANLRKLADTFQTELHALGVDVDQLKKDLGDLGRRVTALEAKKPTIDISGDANLFIAAGNSTDDQFGLNKDGRITGVLKDKSGASLNAVGGLTQDLSVLHELAANFKTTNTTGAVASGTIVIGNALEGLGNESNSVFAPYTPGYSKGGSYQGTAYSDQGNDTVYIQNLGVSFKSSIAGLGFSADIGRIGYKISPYIFQRPDPSSYFSTDRSSNGEYYLDGGVFGFNIGPAKLDILGGRTSNIIAADGTNVNPLQSGGIGGPIANGNFSATANPATSAVLGIDSTLGAVVSLPLTSSGGLKLAYLLMSSDAVASTGEYPTFAGASANRLQVYGGDANFVVGPIKLMGGYSKSDLELNTTTVNDNKDDAYNVKAAYDVNKFNVYGGYREVSANFIAPGDWGRIGIWRNPTNIKGYLAGGGYKFTPALSVKGAYEHDEGKDSGYGATSGFETGSKLDQYSVDLNYHFNSALDGHVGYEDDKFNEFTGVNGLNPEFQWTTFGIGYGLSDAAKLTLQYELSSATYFVAGGSAYKGGFLTSQLTVKF